METRPLTALETLAPATLYYELAGSDERETVLRYFRLSLNREDAERHWRAVVERHRERVLGLARPLDIRATAFEYFLEKGLLRDPVIVEEEAFQKAETLAYQDRLTGVHNYAYFEQQLRVEVARAERYRTPLALILLDLDGFKRVNDALGHAAGNQVLRDVGWILRKDAREGDVVARIGGDEFGILLHRSSAETARVIAERKRRAVESWFAETELEVTASIGVAELSGPDDTAGALFEAADRALYRAKRGGKNRIARACSFSTPW